MKVIYSDQKIVVPAGQKSIFLAGPTPRDQQTPSWRIEALTILDGLGFNGIVFVPESSNGQPKETTFIRPNGSMRHCISRPRLHSGYHDLYLICLALPPMSNLGIG